MLPRLTRISINEVESNLDYLVLFHNGDVGVVTGEDFDQYDPEDIRAILDFPDVTPPPLHAVYSGELGTLFVTFSPNDNEAE